MRIQLLDFEGTAAELADVPELRDALRRLGSSAEPLQPPSVATTSTVDGELPMELHNFIAVRAGNVERANAVRPWVSEVLGWGTTDWELGTSRNSGDGLNNYFMLHAHGPRHFGAFAYVHPGQARVTFRLDADDAKDYDQAVIKDVQNGYKVMVYLKNDAAYDQAIALAKLALDGVQR